jgi:hypothetical protein
MPSLKVRRLRSIAIETFKIIHKQSPIYLHDLVNIKKHNYSFRYENTDVLHTLSCYPLNQSKSVL